MAPQVEICERRRDMLQIKKAINEKKGISTFGYTQIPLCRLSTETELLDDSPVSLDVDFLEIIKYTTSFTYEFQERATG